MKLKAASGGYGKDIQKKAKQDLEKGEHGTRKTSTKRSRATMQALKRESRSAASRKALSSQARSAACRGRTRS